MNGILYFSSTGNSLYIAQKLQQKIGGDILYIPNYKGTGSEFDKIFIVTPIYSYGMPRHVYELLPRLDKSKPLVVIQNYGGMSGGADYLMWQYCEKFSLNIKGVHVIKMPENFTVSFTVPKFYLKGVLKKSVSRVNKLTDLIAEEKYRVPKAKKTHEKTWLKNMSNWHIIGQRFSSNEKCIKCGKCISICPAHNIKFNEEGRIEFLDNCVACLGCYHRCPAKAIVYQNKNKKDRYVNPNISENDIGKDVSER